jgi:hypothetical protein
MIDCGARVALSCWHSAEARGVEGRRASVSPRRAEGESQPSEEARTVTTTTTTTRAGGPGPIDEAARAAETLKKKKKK